VLLACVKGSVTMLSQQKILWERLVREIETFDDLDMDKNASTYLQVGTK
jgi:hypothetical protein